MLKFHRIRRAALAALVTVITLASAARGAVSEFDDIQFWAGDGSSATNRAAMVIQWNLDPSSPFTSHSIVWGFGWNSGAPTGWDMLTSIAIADPRLGRQLHPSFEAVFGLFYDVANDGSGFVAGTPGDLGGPEDGHAMNPANYYQEGWYDGFWNYSVFAGTFSYDNYGGPPNYEYLGTDTYDTPGSANYADVVWFAAPIGASSRQLVNGAWDAWSFAPGFADQAILTPSAAAVPEPATIALLALGAFVAFAHVKKRIHTA